MSVNWHSKEAYLDIETTGLSVDNEITVIGIYLADGADSRFVQIVGEEINVNSLLEVLRGVNVIYTYNGSRFDIPFIQCRLGINLAATFMHCDLMYRCWQNNLYGGLKAVEVQLGMKRQLKGVNGFEAIRLWRKYRRYNDRNALMTLLEYNREDVLNLKVLRERLGWFTNFEP